MKGFDMGKIKDSLNDIQKKLLKIVLILVGMEVVVTLLIGLPLSAAMFHTERLKDGITARDFFVFSDLLNFRTWVFSFVILLVAPLLYYAVTPQNRRMKGVNEIEFVEEIMENEDMKRNVVLEGEGNENEDENYNDDNDNEHLNEMLNEMNI